MLVVSTVLFGGFAALVGMAGPVPASSVTSSWASSHRGLAAPSAGITHGDLVVPNGHTVFLPSPSPPPGEQTYFQGGNVTVETGGVLVITNTTFSFVQYVGDTGIPAARLGHVFRFVDNGTVLFQNSTLTTTTVGLNPYAKLQVTVHGEMTFWNSSVLTAGSIVVGAGGVLTLNRSTIAGNPTLAALGVPQPLLGDSAFAPTLNVSEGGQINLFASSYRAIYGNNLATNGTPGPLPLTAAGVPVATSTNWSSFLTPTDSLSLAQDYAYPRGIGGGTLTIKYDDTNAGPTNTNVTLWYGEASYPLGAVTLMNTGVGTVSLPFTPDLVAAINASGMMTYLNRTGDFGLPPGISVAFDVSSGPTVSGTNLSLQLAPPTSYDLEVSGGTSRISTVDSTLGLNFLVPNNTTPWLSHKLVVSAGAQAYLGNLTVVAALANGSSSFVSSAILTRGTSHAYLFRWAEFSALGRSGALAIQNATVTAPYAYDGSQANNLTAKTQNKLSTADPALWGYVQYWDVAHHAAGYGKSDPLGIASLLLVSNDLYAGSLPGGDYLGDYHIVVRIPISVNNTTAFNWSVTPYPQGVAADTSGYGMPDLGPTLTFPSYYAGLVVVSGSVTTTANGTSASTVRIGQSLGVRLTVRDTGTAPITSIESAMFYTPLSTRALAFVTNAVSLTAPDQTAALDLSWTVNDTITGLRQASFSHAFPINIAWNHNLASAGGGATSTSATVVIVPSQVGLVAVSFPPSSLAENRNYFIGGYVNYNGSQPATVELIATPVGGGAALVLAQTSTNPVGPGVQHAAFGINWSSASLARGTSYHLSVVAIYNSVTANDTPTTEFSVPSPAPSNFLLEKLFGLPIWLWIVAAAVVVAAIVLFLMIARRRAAGRLVECGECGNLIPEDAKACPKCGAEFESDVVRCSRCASTIPANSQFCPECAAQLLGKPAEGAALDPERQAYADFTERYRAEARKELGANFTEGAFWDWWKRQPTYTPFGQWKTQQGQGASRTGAAAPPSGGAPPFGGGEAGAPPPASMSGGGGPARPGTGGAEASAVPAAAPGALRPCPSCAKQIPPDYLVCPFCGAVTQ